MLVLRVVGFVKKSTSVSGFLRGDYSFSDFFFRIDLKVSSKKSEGGLKTHKTQGTFYMHNMGGDV